jgi:hypothetical protein
MDFQHFGFDMGFFVFFFFGPPLFRGENLQIEFLAAMASVALYIFTTQVPQAL